MFDVNIIILSIYGIALLLILGYSIMQMSLVINYRSNQKKRAKKDPGELSETMENYPFVTVQLPLYNEMFVVERLIDAIAAFDYPKNRFEIQVLDDSTDASIEISKKKVDEIKNKGFEASLIIRPERIGFKAGALDYGLKYAKGEFIVIFDADFIPDPDFLKKTIP